MHDLAFLHTAAVHVHSFDSLLRELAPRLSVRHVVRDDLLADARRLGCDHPQLKQALSEVLTALGQQARTVLCTCSSIGGIAERTGKALAISVLRVDRPMVEQALSIGPRVVVAATLASTVQPTIELIVEVAGERDMHVEPRVLVIDEAWPLFEQGDQEGFHRLIAQQLLAIEDGDCVILAQASMAGAVSYLHDFKIPVLSSPVLGLRAAVEQACKG